MLIHLAADKVNRLADMARDYGRLCRTANSVRRPANPLREEPFLSTRGRKPRMQRPPVRCALFVHIPEQDRIALAAAIAPVEREERGLRRIEFVIEIDEECRDALARGGDVLRIGRHRRIEEIEMRRKLLAH